MSRKRITVAHLAQQAGAEYDEALVMLWDAGLDGLDSISDFIAPADLKRARRALSLAGAKEMGLPGYWTDILGLDSAQWQRLLDELGIGMSPHARRLPKGAIGKLTRYARGSYTRGTVPRGRQQAPLSSEARGPFMWRTVGKERAVENLTAEDLESIHEALVDEFAHTDDPFGDPHGVRDSNLLESTAFRPATMFGEDRKYGSVEMGAAALLHSVVNNHPFYNGNKRTALVAMLALLDAHDITLVCHEDELFKLVLRVAQHAIVPKDASDLSDREVMAIAGWIRNNSRRLTRGERPLKWSKLRKILNGFDCTLEPAPGVGNRMNIYRDVSLPGRFGRRRTVRLSTQVAYGDEGREVERNTLHKIRSDLQLDDANGVDSEAFYGDADTPRDIIFRYQRTLRRLAKL